MTATRQRPRLGRHGPPTDPVEANARLTGATAAVLLVLLAAEGATLLSIRSLVTPHVVIGMILVPPVMLKMTSTGWRFVRYYRRDPAFRRKGPPAPILRLLGPAVVVLTTVVFASGIILLVGPAAWDGQMLLVHKASFVLWFGAMAIHVLGHLRHTAQLAPRDWAPRAKKQLSGARGRRVGLVVSLVLGAALGAALVGDVGTFLQHAPLGHHHVGRGALPTPPKAALSALSEMAGKLVA